MSGQFTQLFGRSHDIGSWNSHQDNHEAFVDWGHKENDEVDVGCWQRGQPNCVGKKWHCNEIQIGS
jgi:hypothetical protein